MALSIRHVAAAACAAGSLCAHAVVATPNLVYNFDDGAQGWTVFDGGTMVWQATGGNNGGYLQISDATDGDFRLDAPAQALGNLSAYLGGSISFDARNLDGAAPDWGGFGLTRLESPLAPQPEGALSVDPIALGEPAIAAGWKRYTIELTPQVWGASLPSVLGNVTRLLIEAEFHAGQPEMVGIDNISISAVPEPTEFALLLAGLGLVGWQVRRRSNRH